MKEYEITPNAMKFGLLLEKAIRKRRLKFKEVSRRIGFSPTVIHKYIYGRSVPRLDRFAKIIKTLKLTPVEIMEMLNIFLEEE